MNDEDQKLVDDFRKNLAEEMHKHLNSGPVTKEDMTKILTKQLGELGFAPRPLETPEVLTLWQSMSRLDRFLWRLFRWWPLKRIAEETREKINTLNADIRALEERLNELDENFGIGSPVKFPAIFEPSPKSILLVKMPVTAPIEMVSVTVTIPAEGEQRSDYAFKAVDNDKADD
jgi:hypothetical protein